MNRAARTACDRCHGQKMKCIREPGQSKCNRCLPSHFECVFSPSRKAGRPLAGRALNPTKTSPATPRPKSNHSATTSSNQIVSTYDESFTFPAESFDFSLPTLGDAFGSPTMSPDTDNFLYSPFTSSDASTQEMDALGLGGTFAPEQGELSHKSFDDLTTLFSEPRSRAPTTQHSHPEPDKMETDSSSPSALAAVYQLSAFSASLCASVELYLRNEEKSTCAAPMEELGRMAADVLQSSLTFLRILKTFVDAVSADKSDTPDTPATLQIVTAYIRLTQLHRGLYVQIKSLLLSSSAALAAEGSTSSHKSALPAIFPDLALGGLSLASFARFQLKFIVQSCVHELGIIEAMLGLPAGCRVSDVGSTSPSERPLLSACDGKMGLLVWTVLAEVEQPVHGIRDTLIELRESFRGSIQI
ncbi:unnamed protein product [Periconia digitata]|uniref:Zn(2)-C6 fungal-type domain-containing protein n=1 Tax=Periconia digitata TaxID=1303443 RepID=A0A9W4UKT1_9PLEO|nr:unnamed protein product [Periconia digitata]